MNKKFTLSVLSLLFAVGLTAQVKTFTLDLSAPGFMGSASADFSHWHYFSFAEGQIVGTSDTQFENIEGGIGTETVNSEWAERSDWDIAFHAFDIRTNSGTSGNGLAGAVKIEDSHSEENLADIFTNLTEAPETGYAADKVVTLESGWFYFGMNVMPPLRSASMSVSEASLGFASLGMGGNTENPMVIAFKTADGKYAKVYLKQFLGDGTEGNPEVGAFVMDYVYQPDGSRDFTTETGIINLQEIKGEANIAIYTLSGAIVKQAKAQAQSIPVAGLAKGIYIVKISAENTVQTRKIVIK
ncbi:MAG: hypothetical protein EZS26_002859 [Candidatus Ordinivivax streblomastigis]|uniref:Secretion system C-terminal sorting domain-containing protein n=1 Tax=Candidatus Ordinivivax streblomastigis TaxID=2540710 RepID=A0A5M8NX21_9BACT|nr:MAG: hypothetical protein EZS26_002859 [Candidatus Ordinivivax streblomastigis]